MTIIDTSPGACELDVVQRRLFAATEMMSQATPSRVTEMPDARKFAPLMVIMLPGWPCVGRTESTRGGTSGGCGKQAQKAPRKYDHSGRLFKRQRTQNPGVV